MLFQERLRICKDRLLLVNRVTMVIIFTTGYASGQFSINNGTFDVMRCSGIAKLGHTRACVPATRGYAPPVECAC